ncbi:MAG: SDR family NAD(P)-dependent oxidoreductase, partial [Verrucomicrobiota bacterium]
MAGKRVLITGVSRGLGLAMANWFMERGHNVAGCARSSSAPSGWDSETYPYSSVDLSNEEAVRSWADSLLDSFGTPDLLINNAAI